jgi:glycosyltransferase involved in cell wall biosynthesis
MNKPVKLSVLMCVFNGGKFIRSAIKSIFSQTMSDFELIIIDDGSNDNTSTIVHEFSDPRLRYFRNNHNLGIVRSRTIALSHARANLIALHDSDDVSFRERFQKQVDYLANNPDIGLVGCNAKFYSEKTSREVKIKRWDYSSENLKYSLIFRNSFVHSTLMFRRETLPSPAYPLEFSVCEDYYFLCRIAENHKIAMLSKSLLMYRQHEASTSNEKADLVRALSLKVKSFQLTRLGVTYSTEELRLHHSLDSPDPYQTIDSLLEVAKWLTKIQVEANIAPQHKSALDTVIRNEWYERCLRNSTFGLDVVKIYQSLKTLCLLTEDPVGKLRLLTKTLVNK